jgi:hypothetical protein
MGEITNIVTHPSRPGSIRLMYKEKETSVQSTSIFGFTTPAKVADVDVIFYCQVLNEL